MDINFLRAESIVKRLSIENDQNLLYYEKTVHRRIILKTHNAIEKIIKR